MSYARVQPLLPLHLDELVGFDEPEEWSKVTRIQTTSSIHRIPTAQAIATGAVRRPSPTPARSGRLPTPTVVTFRTRSSAARKMMWPVFLCGFIAGIAGGFAVLKSPVGERPVVQHLVKKTNHAMKGIVR